MNKTPPEGENSKFGNKKTLLKILRILNSFKTIDVVFLWNISKNNVGEEYKLIEIK